MALEYALHERPALAGVAVSGPPLNGPEGRLQSVMALLAAAVSPFAPGFALPLPLASGGVSRVPRVVDACRADPLVHRRGSARWATETLAAMRWVLEHAAEWSLPLFVSYGTADRLVDPRGVSRLLRRVPSALVELHARPGGFHEPHNDIDRERFFSELVAWIERVTGRAPPAAPPAGARGAP